MIWRRASISLLRSASRIFFLVGVDPGGGEVAEHLADDVMVAGFLEIGADHILGVAFGFRLVEAHLPRRPFAEQPVAARE